MSWFAKIKAAMRLSDSDRLLVVWSLASAAYWVACLWGFWRNGPLAFGANAFVYLLLTGGLLAWTLRRQGVSLSANWWWLAPLGLIAAGFLIYDNPFLKVISFLLLPVLVALFYNSAMVADQNKAFWGLRFLGAVIVRCLKAIPAIRPSVGLHLRLFNTSRGERSVVRRVVLGLVLLLVIALTVILPLLSSADAEFARRVDFVLDWARQVISTDFASRLLAAAALSVGTLAVLLAWGRKLEFDGRTDQDSQPIDSIVAGIVLGGILAVYLLFLWVQVEKMWVGRLPFEFATAVQLVKSGFWQLICLSVINIAIYFFAYRRTGPAVQKLLLAFTAASLLLLVSAGHRVALYVTYYGLSYEKISAAYTVLFCAILFVWLIYRLLTPRRADILKFLAVLFLWMFAVLTVLPVEQVILRSNLALARLENSRIRIYELTMLSPDVLGTVRRLQASGGLAEVNPVGVDLSGLGPEERQRVEQPDWTPWIDRQERIVADKRWYERTLVDWASR